MPEYWLFVLGRALHRGERFSCRRASVDLAEKILTLPSERVGERVGELEGASVTARQLPDRASPVAVVAAGARPAAERSSAP